MNGVDKLLSVYFAHLLHQQVWISAQSRYWGVATQGFHSELVTSSQRLLCPVRLALSDLPTNRSDFVCHYHQGVRNCQIHR